MTDEQGGRFRINQVAESTGTPEATLRAWERRYQVPRPERTPSGYRLYSAEDVAQVRKMRELCDGGISPADAAKEILTARERAAKGAARIAAKPALQAPSTSAPQASASTLTEMVMPEHTNTAGVLSLTRALSLMERAALVAATRATRRSTIVVGCGSVDLSRPVGVGQLVEAAARVLVVRENTLTVETELAIEDVHSATRQYVAKTTMMLVTIEG